MGALVQTLLALRRRWARDSGGRSNERGLAVQGESYVEEARCSRSEMGGEVSTFGRASRRLSRGGKARGGERRTAMAGSVAEVARDWELGIGGDEDAQQRGARGKMVIVGARRRT